MSVLDQYSDHSSLFASPLGTLLTQGCLARLRCANDQQQLANAAQQLFQQYSNADIVLGLIPFNTTKCTQLLVPATHHYYPEYVYAKNKTTNSALKNNSNHVVHIEAKPRADQFETHVEQALAALQETRSLKKLVMARHLDVELAQALDRKTLLDALWSKNPNGYTYAMPLDDKADPATFLGASPELLLRREGDQVFLNPLAGTAMRNLEDAAADKLIANTLLQSGKDQHEHAIVIQNILEALGPYCDQLEAASTPNLVATATLWHLSTEIRGTLKHPYADALTLALAIHPTPAVCGHPTLLARDHVESIEPIDRNYFAGAVGWMNRQGDGEWAVAIRCAHYQNRQLRLSAGAGIVEGSVAELERIETGNKLRTLLNALHIDPKLLQQGITQ